MESLDTFLQSAEEAARIAGGVLSQWAEKFSVSEKGPSDLVTEADLASQDAIHQFLRSRFPDHHFLGEEDLRQSEGDSEYCWVIDPLDGTSNYVHGFPYYAVSIGLEWKREMIVGVIFDPNRDEMFTAARGEGARLNGRVVHTSSAKTLKDAMVVASLPVGARPDDPAVGRFLTVMPHVQTIQRTGSAALNMSYVASGRIDAFWSTSLKPWDMAAGAVIVTEAGGRVSRREGGPFDMRVPDVLCSNGSAIHDGLQELLR